MQTTVSRYAQIIATATLVAGINISSSSAASIYVSEHNRPHI
jgi:hypothetical protein